MPAGYYPGAMAFVIVYDKTDEQSFQNVRNWMRMIEKCTQAAHCDQCAA
jgi:GTPase SAR1 family protein